MTLHSVSYRLVQMGRILAVLVRMTDRRECCDKKVISQCRDYARWAYNGVVFEVKKEIPIKMAIYCITNATNGVTKQGEIGRASCRERV